MTAADPLDLRVLLFSPLEGRDPLSGDTTYTASLLASPPAGVRFTTYEEALVEGTLVVRGRKPTHGLGSPRDWLIFLVRTAELLLRRSKLMFREPTWFVTIDDDSFDLVHLHLFPVRQVQSRRPIFSSAGYPLTVLYQQREGWTKRRARLAEALELLWSRALRVHTPWLYGRRGSLMSVYSPAAQDYLVKHAVPQDRTCVVSTGLAELADVPSAGRTGAGLLFVGREYGRKGGDVALAAFRELQRERPDVSLTIVTSRDHAPEILDPDVEWVFDAARSHVTDVIMPRCDVLLAPTQLDCGAPYGVLEAMQRGLAVVMSPGQWLDQRLTAPGVQHAPPNAAAFAATLVEMLNGSRLRESQQAALALWRDSFTAAQLAAALGSRYRQLLP